MYSETSAKTAAGVNEAFMGTATQIYEKMLTTVRVAAKILHSVPFVVSYVVCTMLCAYVL